MTSNVMLALGRSLKPDN